MKKIILAITLLLVVSCTKSPEDQAKKNITEYLKKNMDDPSSYESVEFGKLDTLHSAFNESKEGIALRNEDAKLELKMDDLSKELDTNPQSINRLKQIQVTSDSITKRRREINDVQLKNANYKGDFVGFNMTHKFRGKNKLGAVILNEKRFLLDTKFNVQGTEE